MTNQSEQAKRLETVEQAAQKLFDRGSYKNDSQLQLTYLAGARFGAQWQQSQLDKELERLQSENTDLFYDVEQLTIQRDQLLKSQPGIKQWVSIKDALLQIAFIYSDHDSGKIAREALEVETILDDGMPKSDMVSKAYIIDLLQAIQCFQKYASHIAVIQECITKIKDI